MGWIKLHFIRLLILKKPGSLKLYNLFSIYSISLLFLGTMYPLKKLLNQVQFMNKNLF